MAKKRVQQIAIQQPPKTVWEGIIAERNVFETWVNSWLPGLKTRLVTGLGAVGGAAASLQEYVTGLPLTKWISAETVTLVVAGLFTLSYWFHGLGERVEENK